MPDDAPTEPPFPLELEPEPQPGDRNDPSREIERWRAPDEDWEDPRITRRQLWLLDGDDDGLGERMHERWLAERGL